MTYLLLQTFLLLLASYFAGAFLACLVKRMPFRQAHAAMRTQRPVSVALRPQTVSRSNVSPRSIDPVQPKIDLLPRPEPRPAPMPSNLDTTRFERALTGPDPNAGMPRKAIVEIRPKVLKSPTDPAQPTKQKPQPAPASVSPAPANPSPKAPETSSALKQPAAPATQATPVTQATGEKVSAPSVSATQTSVSKAEPPPAANTEPQPVPKSERQPAGAAAATAAAAAAVAAAKAAAASAATHTTKPAAPVAQPSPAPVGAAKEPAPAKPKQPEPAPTPLAGDDLQRIRAIDAEIERRLQGINIRRFDDIALWTAADISRVDQALGLAGRIDREQWIEQAQILAKGGETYYSRNRAAAVAGKTSPVTPEKSQAQLQPAVQPQAAPQTVSSESAPKQAATPPSSAVPTAALSNQNGRSVAEMASAAAAAIAAASASVTRGIRPIEPISPLSRANPNISMPAKLSDAIKDKVAAAAPANDATATKETAAPRPAVAEAGGDDLKRIRGIGVLIEKRLNSLGVSKYTDIANWTSGDIDRISQTLEFKGRIERESWVEQARILSSGGHTEFSRRVDRGDVESSKDPV